MTVSPQSLTGLSCGTTLTVTYTATFHIAPNGPGGTIQFLYTWNGGHVMNGIDLIRALYVEATARKTVSPPVVLLSATAAINTKGVHIDAWIAKPFNLSELERVIQLLCKQASSEQGHSGEKG